MEHQSHLFDVEVAKQYGVNAAIIIRHFQFWIIKNKSHKKHFHDGRTWTYCSVDAFTEIYPYWSIRQVRVILDKLIKEGVLIKGKYNPKGYDRTTWYAFKDEKPFVNSDKCICQSGQKNLSKPADASVNPDEPITNPSTTDDLQINKPNQVLLNPQEILALDLRIVEDKKFFMEQLDRIFRFNKTEARTFAGIIKYLVAECQACRLKPAIFKDAAEWARQAKSSNAANPKGLLVAKIKQETGFKAQVNLLDKTKNLGNQM